MPLAIVWLLALALLLPLVTQNVIPYEQLLLDPSHANNLPWYTGLVSNLGILAWTTATVAALGGAWVSHMGGRSRASSMMRGGATLSLLLLLDDLFQFHVVIPNSLGFPKVFFYVGYLVLTWWWVASERHELRRTNTHMLLAAGGAFAASILIDQVGIGSKDTGLILEDAAKFLGVLAWALYFVLTSRDITNSVVTGLRDEASRSAAIAAQATGENASSTQSPAAPETTTMV